MSRPRRKHPRRAPQPLRVSLADRVGTEVLGGQVRAPSAHVPHLMPTPPRSARDVVGLLMATTGLALAARKDARVELLPGMPITVVLTAGDQPAAAFVLPIDECEARRMFGQPATAQRNHLLEQLFEEQRQAELASPDILLDQRRAFTWGMEDHHAC